MFRQVASLVAIGLFLGLGSASTAWAQIDGGIDPGALEQDIFDAVEQGGGAANTGGTTGTTDAASGFDGGSTGIGSDAGFEFDDLFSFGNFGDASQGTTNERDFPFVGVTIGEVPERYNGFRHVGPIQDSFGSADGGAGGTLSTRGNATTGGGGGNESGFEVLRPATPVRSRILPRFSSRPLSRSFVTSQINQRFNPADLRQAGIDANVSVQGRTAVLSGTATSQQTSPDARPKAAFGARYLTSSQPDADPSIRVFNKLRFSR